MGGWIALGNKTENEWIFFQNQFENRYRGYVMRDEKPEYQARLIGMANAQNSQHGFGLNAPILIGNKSKAESVMKNGSNKALLQFQSAGDSIKYLQ